MDPRTRRFLIRSTWLGEPWHPPPWSRFWSWLRRRRRARIRSEFGAVEGVRFIREWRDGR